MKTIIALIAIGLGCLSLTAQDITITVTAAQVKAVTRVVARMNAERVINLVAGQEGTLGTNSLTVTFTPTTGTARTATLITALQYGRFLCDAALDSIVRQERALIKQEVAEKYDVAAPATQTTVNTALGVE